MNVLPTLRQLSYLVALVELRHFGRAAEKCFVTQSTLSAGIQELESLLGAELVERTKRKVLPTALGLEVAERARELLVRADDMVDMVKGAGAPLTGRLRLGVIPTIGPFLLPGLLPPLRETYPDLRLYLREDQTARLLAQLAEGELDLVLLALPFETPGMETMELAEDRFWLAFPKGHELGRRARVPAEEIPPDELLLLEDGHCLREHALAACHLTGLRRAGAFQGTSLYTLVQMVANGLGVTFLPEIALRSDAVRAAEVEVRPLGEDSPPRQIGLAWRKSSGRGGEFALLGGFFKDVLAEMAEGPEIVEAEAAREGGE